MAQTFYLLTFVIGCSIILHAHETSAQYNANSFIQPAVPNSLDTQQIVSTNIPSSSNAIASSSASASSGLVPPPLIPNAFTKAVLAIPSLQRFLNLRIPRFQAADLLFTAVIDALIFVRHPHPVTMANIVAKDMAGLDVFTIPLYLYIQGKDLEDFLISEGIKITPDLPQRYANIMEAALRSYKLDSNYILLRAIQTGFIHFVESFGFNFAQKTYVLALIFSEDVVATIRALKP